MRWPTARIDSVVNVNPRLPLVDRPQVDDPVSFVPMAAVSSETLRIETKDECLFSEVSKGYTPFRRGDLLIAKITPCFENGKMALADNLSHNLGFGTTEFHVLRPSQKIIGKYLFHLLRSPYIRKAGAMKMKGAAGQRRVPEEFFASLQIPLPPLSEQKRIAGILDAADALRAKRREALAQLDTLLQSTFLDMFGDPVTNPMGWEISTLGNIATLQRGFDLPVQNRRDGNVPIFAANGQVGTHDSYKVKGPGVVTGRSGTLGMVHYVKHNFWPLNTALWVKDFHGNAPLWVCHLLRLMNLKQFTRGVGVPTLNRNLVHVVDVPVPPISTQRRFATIVESVERQKATMRAHLAELDTLFASLQSRAFNGEL